MSAMEMSEQKTTQGMILGATLGPPPKQAAAEVAVLQDRIATLIVERDQLTADNAALVTANQSSAETIEHLIRERDALKAEVARLRLAIEEIARQHTYDECDEDEQENGDVIGAYDHAIRRARAALSERQDSGGRTANPGPTECR